jgi:hypothetical protein
MWTEAVVAHFKVISQNFPGKQKRGWQSPAENYCSAQSSRTPTHIEEKSPILNT